MGVPPEESPQTAESAVDETEKVSARKSAGYRIRSTGQRFVSGSRRAAGLLTRAEYRSVMRRLAIVAACVAVIGLVVASVGNYIFATHTPAEAVEKQLTRLERGNYFGALDRSAFSDNSVILLKDSIYRKSSQRVEEFSVESVSERENFATVDALITVAGTEEVVSLDLVKEQKQGLFNDTWKLAEPQQKVLKIHSKSPLNRILVNNTTVRFKESQTSVDEHGSTWRVDLLPGTFRFDVSANSYYSLVGGAQEVNLRIGQHSLAPLELKVRPSSRMWDETNQHIEKWAQRCVASRSIAPTGCPTSQRKITGEVTEVEWKLDTRPIMFLEQDKDRADTWHANKSKPAQFTVTYLEDGKKITEKISTSIDATVITDGTSASIEVVGEKLLPSASPSAKAREK